VAPRQVAGVVRKPGPQAPLRLLAMLAEICLSFRIPGHRMGGFGYCARVTTMFDDGGVICTQTHVPASPSWL